jgi:hypothetical protein
MPITLEKLWIFSQKTMHHEMVPAAVFLVHDNVLVLCPHMELLCTDLFLGLLNVYIGLCSRPPVPSAGRSV